MVLILLFAILCMCACTSTPPTAAPDARVEGAAQVEGASEVVTADEIRAPASYLRARVGLEVLSEDSHRPQSTFAPRPVHPKLGSAYDSSFGSATPTLTAASRASIEPRDPRPAGGGDEPRKRETPKPALDFSREHLRSIDDPFERMTMRFFGELIGDDRRRVQRELGGSILNTLLRPGESEAFDTPFSDAEREDRAAQLQRLRGTLINRPLRRALKEMVVVHEVEIALDLVKSEHVPLSGAYQDAHPGEPSLGRFSFRVRPRKENPLEVAYIRREWRVAVSAEQLKLGWRTRPLKHLELGLRGAWRYEDDSLHVFGEMTYELGRRSHFHVRAGDSVDLLTGDVLFPVVDSPLSLTTSDPSIGVLLFVEHRF